MNQVPLLELSLRRRLVAGLTWKENRTGKVLDDVRACGSTPFEGETEGRGILLMVLVAQCVRTSTAASGCVLKSRTSLCLGVYELKRVTIRRKEEGAHT